MDARQGCRGQQVLVVGGGPAGLRAGIELLLMGADVTLVEKRPYLTRNNVLHLWPTTVQEVRPTAHFWSLAAI
jgi:2-polyprenyl-6-methoxyphenol hydroxylase-like FAD-dependent oxidoreductase